MEYNKDGQISGKTARVFHKNIDLETLLSDKDDIQFNAHFAPVEHATSITASKKTMVDSRLVMVYWRQALEIPFGKVQGMNMMAAVESGILGLATAFPPPRPKVFDRHFEEALQKYGAGRCGVYHFARWAATGQKRVIDPILSRDLISSSSHNGAYIFYRQIAPFIQATSLLFQAADPQMHLHYLKQYRYVSPYP